MHTQTPETNLLPIFIFLFGDQSDIRHCSCTDTRRLTQIVEIDQIPAQEVASTVGFSGEQE